MKDVYLVSLVMLLLLAFGLLIMKVLEGDYQLESNEEIFTENKEYLVNGLYHHTITTKIHKLKYHSGRIKYKMYKYRTT